MKEQVISAPKGVRKKKRAQNRPIRVSTVVTYLMLLLYTVILFAPFVIILFESFTGDVEIGSRPSFYLVPHEWTFEGYEIIFTLDPNAINGVSSLLVGFFNTMWQTLIPLVGGLITSAFSAYIFSKFRFPGRKVLFMVTVLTMMLPMGAFSFVGYLFYMKIGWVGDNGVLAILIPGLFGGASTVFFLRSYFDSALSNEVLEAAKIDGAGNVRIFFAMVLPLAKPALIAQFLFGFVGGYNNYSTALLYLYPNKEMWSLQLALSELVSMVSQDGSGYANAQCASALIAMLPLILLYVFVQKYFIEGINIGGGKE